jgi:hypothetical protein
MDDLTEAGEAQAVAIGKPFQAKVARRGHKTVSGKATLTFFIATALLSRAADHRNQEWVKT